MAKFILEIIKESEKMPDWLTEITTSLQPKTNQTMNVKNLPSCLP